VKELKDNNGSPIQSRNKGIKTGKEESKLSWVQGHLCAPLLHNVTVTVAEGTGPRHNHILQAVLGSLLSQEVTAKITAPVRGLKVWVRPLFTLGETEVQIEEGLVQVSVSREGCTNPIAQPLNPHAPEQEGKNLTVPVTALCPFLHNVTITVSEGTGPLHKWVLESPLGGLLSHEVIANVGTERNFKF
jgi:hypothetical protein